MFRCLSIFELCNLRLVWRGFEQIVNYSIKFKRVADLTNDICDEILCRKKIQKNLLKFKQSVFAESFLRGCCPVTFLKIYQTWEIVASAAAAAIRSR